jgi:hypothetical protein
MIPKQPFAFHSDSWTGPPQATAGPYALPKCRTYACSATTCPYSWLPLQHVFLHVESSNQKKQIRVVGGMSTPRADWLLGLPLTQNSRHVDSTFKRLTPITTHCDLTKIQQHRQGIIPFHDIVHNPVRHPYSDNIIVNNQFLYRASDRKSPDFYRSY